MARNHQSPATVAALAADRIIGATQPSGQEAGQKSIARTQYVEHRHAWAGHRKSILDMRRNGPGDDRAAEWPQLDHQGGRGQGTDAAQGRHQVQLAAGDAEFVFGTDDQVEMRQDFLNLARDLFARNVTRLPVARRRQPPQDGAIVNVEDSTHVMVAGALQCAQAAGAHAWRREVRAGDMQGRAVGDERLVDILGAESHVGAVIAVKQ